MTLAIFDLDETLIATDSGSAWIEYLADNGLVDESFIARDAAYMELYNAGELSMEDYMAFSLEPVQGKTRPQLAELMPDFVEQKIVPHIYLQAAPLFAELRQSGHRILIISATVNFVVEAIAQHLGVEDVLAIDIEYNADGRITGRTEGVLSFREGKVIRLQQWLEQTGESLQDAHFYSDSINDLPLLEFVDQPFATNPHPRLQPIAEQQGWPILDWR